MSQAVARSIGTLRIRKAAGARKIGKQERGRKVRELADVVREAIDDGATSVEQIHKAIAGLPLDILERLDGFEGALRRVRRIQDQSIGSVYDVIRRVNAEVTRLAADLIEGRAKKPRKGTREAS